MHSSNSANLTLDEMGVSTSQQIKFMRFAVSAEFILPTPSNNKTSDVISSGLSWMVCPPGDFSLPDTQPNIFILEK